MKRRNNNFKILYIINSWIICIGLLNFLILIFYDKKNDFIEELSLNLFYELNDNVIGSEILEEIVINEIKTNDTLNYIGILKIPKINLEKGFFDIRSIENNIEYNIQILEDSNMPNEKNGNFILAAHSGIGNNAYFNDLNKLNINDEIILYYDKYQYIYKIVKVYEIEKTGIAHILRNNNVDTLTLVTCINNTNKQLIIIAEKEGV